MPELSDVRKLLEENKLKEALEILKMWTSSHIPEKQRDVELQLARVSMAVQAFTKGIKPMAEYDAERLKITDTALMLVEECEREKDGEKASIHTSGLSEYHAYTCDRVDHSDAFRQTFGQSTENPQYFSLYGGDMQSHEGFFRRMSYDLEGSLQNYLNAELTSTSQALQLEVTFESSKQLDIYKQNVLKSLFSTFGLSANEHEPLMSKDLPYVLERSPRTTGLKSTDYICIYIHISEYDWDAQLTPEAASWFVKEFCGAPLPDDTTPVLVFFAVEYDEDDEKIRGEVQSTILEIEKIKALPELDMVSKRDIGQWLERYKQVAVNTKARKQILKEVFGQTEEHYMEDVEIELKKIIDQYNNTQTA